MGTGFFVAFRKPFQCKVGKTITPKEGQKMKSPRLNLAVEGLAFIDLGRYQEARQDSGGENASPAWTANQQASSTH
jgi:hypothetical protein